MRATAPGAPRPVAAGRAPDGATRRRVIDAAVTCILDRGFYRASSNEIARTAGVSWGVIQHHFGSRENLMLAVLHDGAERYCEAVQDVHVTGDTVEERVDRLLDVLSAHYGEPPYLAYLQILLNLDHDPTTSNEVRKTMREVAERSNGHVRRLLREALGPAASVPDLATTVFLVLRGFCISQQLQETMPYDTVAPKGVRVARQRRLLAQVLAPYLQQARPG